MAAGTISVITVGDEALLSRGPVWVRDACPRWKSKKIACTRTCSCLPLKGRALTVELPDHPLILPAKGWVALPISPAHSLNKKGCGALLYPHRDHTSGYTNFTPLLARAGHRGPQKRWGQVCTHSRPLEHSISLKWIVIPTF